MAVEIQKFVNEFYSSNTYLISIGTENLFVYLIDIGNVKAVLSSLKSHQEVKAIFLTHPHYDHICGIHELISTFPNCLIYCSPYTKLALADSKINLSFYHGTPIAYEGSNVLSICESDRIHLFDGVTLKIIETPGHNEGSLTFKIDNTIFTGDSLIPGYPVVTKLKSGNKEDAAKSVLKIIEETQPSDILYPGHGVSCNLSEIDLNFYIGHDWN